MKEIPFAFLNCPQGTEVIKRLELQYPRKTIPGDPLETYSRSCQADVVDWIKRMVKEHSKPQAGETTGAR